MLSLYNCWPFSPSQNSSPAFTYLIRLLPCSLGSTCTFFMFFFGSSLFFKILSSMFFIFLLTLVPLVINSKSISQALLISQVSKLFFCQLNEHFQFFLPWLFQFIKKQTHTFSQLFFKPLLRARDYEAWGIPK